MADFPALPLFTDALIADTVHLTNEEFGCYMRLLVFAWRTSDCRLPDDDMRLRTMLGVSAFRWAKIRPVLMQFFVQGDGYLIQKKLSKVRNSVAIRVQQQSEAGRRSAEARALKRNKQGATGVATGHPTTLQRGVQEPKPNLSKDKGKGDFFDFWEGKIQAGDLVPQTALTAQHVRTILARGNVTIDQLKASGVEA